MVVSSTRRFVAVFHGATRGMNTKNGNPQWTLHTSDGDYRIEPDAALGHLVSNYLEDATDSLVGREVEFSAYGAGRSRVWKMQPTGKD